MNQKAGILYFTIVERLIFILSQQFGWQRGLSPSQLYGTGFFILNTYYSYKLGGNKYVRSKICKRKS